VKAWEGGECECGGAACGVRSAEVRSRLRNSATAELPLYVSTRLRLFFSLEIYT
jgi:hypothetical protein